MFGSGKSDRKEVYVEKSEDRRECRDDLALEDQDLRVHWRERKGRILGQCGRDENLRSILKHLQPRQ